MPAPQLIPPHAATPATSHDSQGHPRTLPPDLIRDASTRLGILSLLAAALWLLGTILAHLTLRFNSAPGDTRWRSLVMPVDALAVGSILVSLAFYAYTRRSTDPKRNLDLGLAFMIVTAFALGVMFHISVVFKLGRAPAGLTIRPELSWIGAVVLMFAAIVPTPPKKTMIAAFIAVSMNPIGMLIARAYGSWDFGATSAVFVMHYPDYLLVGVAGVISHVVTQLGRQVTKAREMGSYRLGDLLGRGGMGEVYRATHTMLARPAAVKLIRPEALGGADGEAAQLAAKRFTREAEAAANLRSPHTVEVYDFGVTEDGTLYYVMEMLEGMDLESFVKHHGALSPGRCIYLLRQVCESLEEAHRSGLVHRDIKPANIHVGRLGIRYDFAKVLDFGLVKPVKKLSREDTLATAAGIVLGTPAYMAPELSLGEDVDSRADIYALGCVAYFLLTGKLVFESDNPMRLVVRHMEERPAPPSRRTEQHIPRSLDDAVLGCLAKNPASRTQSAAAFAAALDRAAADVEPWGEAEAAAWWTRQTTAPTSPLATASAPTAVG